MAVKKWIGPVRAKMERAGTTGSLREIARRRGLLKGEEDTLTEQDLSRLAAIARRMKGKDGQLTKEGLELLRKVNFARNVRK
jgi:hypothetical protein